MTRTRSVNRARHPRRPIAALALALLSTIEAARAQDLPGFFSSPEALTSSTSGELIGGKTVRLSGELAIIFMGEQVGDSWNYLKLKPEAAKFLVEDPKVVAPDGVTVKIISAVATANRIMVGNGTGEGFKIRCEVEIGTDGPVKAGMNSVVVSFPEVSETARVIKAKRPTSPPSCEFVLKTWVSEEAYLDEKAAEERARQEREAAEEKSRQERQAAAYRIQVEQQAEAEKQARRFREAEEARAREELFGRLGILAATTVPVGLMGWYARRRWRAIHGAYFAAESAPAEGVKPGLIASRFEPAAWLSAIRSPLADLRRMLQGRSEKVAGDLLDALGSIAGSEATIAAVGREAAIEATRTGELHTRLLAIEGRPVYLMAFPDSTAHARLIRRHRGLGDGWAAHAARVYRALAGAASNPSLLCLLFFLAPDGRAGQLAFAFEAPDGRIASAEIVEGEPVDDARTLVRAEGGTFPLAVPEPGRPREAALS